MPRSLSALPDIHGNCSSWPGALSAAPGKWKAPATKRLLLDELKACCWGGRETEQAMLIGCQSYSKKQLVLDFKSLQ